MRHRLLLTTLAFAGLSAGATGAARLQQQAPPISVEALELAVDRLLESRSYPPDPRDMKGLRDRQLLQTALTSQDAALRALAVRSMGRFENPADLTVLTAFLKDIDPLVRHEAAHAIVVAAHRNDQSLQQAVNILMTMSSQRGYAVAGRQGNTVTVVPVPPQQDVALQEAMSLLHYGNPLPAVVEAMAPRWLVRIIRANPSVRLSTTSLKSLHDMVRVGTLAPNADALEILLRQGDYDVNELWYSARFTCPDAPGAPAGSCGWPVRFVLAQMLEPNDPTFEPILLHLVADRVVQVRLAALRQLALAIPRTRSCRPLLSALIDSSEAPVVQGEAIRLLDPICEERDDISAHLSLLAGDLTGGPGEPPWVATRALEALPRFDAAAASQIVTEQASGHPSAMVRASAARVATALKDEATLLGLAADANDNVRSEALGGLAAIRSARTFELAIGALDSKDHRLIATAAAALTRPPDPDKAAAALVFTLKRLTAEGKDTSREVRLAILTRLDELARIKAGDASLLTSYGEDLASLMKDFDPPVADAAASTLSLIRGSHQSSQSAHRPPQQPREAELRSLPALATIVLANGDRIELDLLRSEAPLTVARFVKLVRDHYYDNTELFRISPLVVAQGGSPGGNDYSGDARFVRDEVGLEHHTRGSVGLMTHGRDTGNMQFFIDLQDQPGFDHEYTVFARVRGGSGVQAGMAAVDALVEGSRIAQISLGNR